MALIRKDALWRIEQQGFGQELVRKVNKLYRLADLLFPPFLHTFSIWHQHIPNPIVKFFSDANADPQLRWEGWTAVSGLHPGVAVDTIINETLDFAGSGVLTYEST